jgi:hypothetical protein
MIATTATVYVLVAIGAAAVMITAALGLDGGVAGLAAVAVVMSAEVVGLSIALSQFRLLTKPGLVVGVTVVLTLSAFWWTHHGRRRFSFPTLRAVQWRRHPALCLLVVVGGATLLFQLFMGLKVAPNEQDSLLYHLPRAAEWTQRHSANQFEPGATADPEINDPGNGELFVAWTMVLTHSDHMANSVQLGFVLAAGAAVAANARLLGFSREAAVFAGTTFVLFPEVVLQAATPQVDVTLSFFVAAAALFLVRGLRRGSATDLVIGAAAFGLALGTKESALFAAASLVVLGAGTYWRYRTPMRTLAAAGSLGVLAVVALGGFIYIQNLVNTGDPSGGQTAATAADFVRAGPFRNLVRDAWTFVDAPGIPASRTVDDTVEPVANAMVATVHGSYYDTPPPVTTDVADDTSGYGLVGLLVLIPVVAITIVRGPYRLRLVAIAATVYVLVFAVRLGYSPEVPRLLMPAVALAAPLLAQVTVHTWLRVSVVCLTLAGAIPALTLDSNKPLLNRGVPNVLRLDRVQTQLIDDQVEIPAVERLHHLIGQHSVLAVVDDGDSPDYALYDPNLNRRVVVIDNTNLNPERLRALGATGAFIWRVGPGGHCMSTTPCLTPESVEALVRLPADAAYLPAATSTVGPGGNGIGPNQPAAVPRSRG